jgi:hypothetical protein
MATFRGQMVEKEMEMEVKGEVFHFLIVFMMEKMVLWDNKRIFME